MHESWFRLRTMLQFWGALYLFYATPDKIAALMPSNSPLVENCLLSRTVDAISRYEKQHKSATNHALSKGRPKQPSALYSSTSSWTAHLTVHLMSVRISLKPLLGLPLTDISRSKLSMKR